VEPEGLFSIDGTAWEVHAIYNTHLILFPYLKHQINFHDGKAYYCTDNCDIPIEPSDHFTIIDTPVLSIALDVAPAEHFGIYLMQPIGVGLHVYYAFPFTVSYFIGIGIMFKIDDNWTPPSE
jgi:hypothetical protein